MRRGAVLSFVLVAGCSSALIVELAPDGSVDGGVTAGDGGGAARDAAVEALAISPYCDSSPPLPAPACPPVRPPSGSGCATSELECVYPIDADGTTELARGVCTGTQGGPVWSFVVKACAHACASMRDAGVTVAIDTGECASSAPAVCAPPASQTTQDIVDEELAAIARTCALGPGQVSWVFFDGGCATELVAPSDAGSACMVSALAARRLPCASEVACGFGGPSPVR
jgi:hypothetical protein